MLSVDSISSTACRIVHTLLSLHGTNYILKKGHDPPKNCIFSVLEAGVEK